MLERINENLFLLKITLPNSPLKWLNSYIIKGNKDQRSLLIDTGYNLQKCIDLLFEGINELSLVPQNTDVLLTHRHSDHTGNASFLEKMGFRIMMAERDFSLMDQSLWAERKKWAIKEGVSEALFNEMFIKNPGRIYAPEKFSPHFVADGDTLDYGGRSFTVVSTPGHSPGHICLYEDKTQILISGDHILYDITPNICTCGPGTDALGDYLDSLEKVSGYKVTAALTAHREFGEKNFYKRVEEIRIHHQKRLEETIAIIKKFPGSDANAIASRMTWNIKSKTWDDFPPGQKWFAISETIAHLDHLCAVHEIKKEIDKSGCYGYYM